MSNVIYVRSYQRKKAGPTAEFVAKTKALAAGVLSEREWNAFVGNVLAMELETELPKLLPDLSRDDHDRLRETY